MKRLGERVAERDGKGRKAKSTDENWKRLGDRIAERDGERWKEIGRDGDISK